METVTLPVKGLNFAGCAREIEKHLGKLAPIAHVEASYVMRRGSARRNCARWSRIAVLPVENLSPDSQDQAALFHNEQKRLLPIGLWYIPQWNTVRLLRLL